MPADVFLDLCRYAGVTAEYVNDDTFKLENGALAEALTNIMGAALPRARLGDNAFTVVPGNTSSSADPREAQLLAFLWLRNMISNVSAVLWFLSIMTTARMVDQVVCHPCSMAV